MVVILKQGNLNRLKRTLRFECKKCGCVFDAEQDEYKSQYSQREMCGWYEIKCPCCEGWVTVDDKEAKRQWNERMAEQQ